jgi:hypothetical protein
MLGPVLIFRLKPEATRDEFTGSEARPLHR